MLRASCQSVSGRAIATVCPHRLARQTGDRASAQRSLQSLTAVSDFESVDPWWEFYNPHEDDADGLLLRMRQMER